MTTDEQFMHRCIELAKLGHGNVAPNPMVGSVLVYENLIIGEGYHQKYGEAHAEVNCINSVKPEHRHLIDKSTIYVSLEPCAHFGKTPPCADLIIRHKIPKVVIGCRDPFELVAGKGIEKLKAAGIEVKSGILEKQCKELNKRFFTFHTQHRPYIVLKWAQTGDGKIAATASSPSDRLLISNEYTNRIVHKWRSEEMSILVGTNTALLDDPELNTRLWPGNSPIRLVVDMNLRLPTSLKLFNGKYPTIIFNTKKHVFPEDSITNVHDFKNQTASLLFYYQVTEDVSLVKQIVNALYQLKIQSVLVEGGAFLIQSFIEEGIWDEARIITNEELFVGNGLPAPVLKDQQLQIKEHFATDTIHIFTNQNQSLIH
ncbi:bifunctional diaminohydroxyphosphoribosylaminopyrimidine deaminase/5-amino-6-(5-phosphoribosylamino)uracil reductase RibD [Chitinophagaceae bacterium LB-8]|uniref:Riboflavin biosynthesis protein RibD n=1 Tax=Paraflavisolibacter caeni TaxID=2982496 RepID=A0A9X2XXN1_9BACT|nr:bifunctional diaminohydroxyphosphoribosylaminopyrimidine deaminase/5-amino-6-(5-phosphoribosylamino)uracil reductase RibD [Paraflavisolibacter caeni]MCU7550587.1 bifunctional diaminohydroxyphosphoribosylaminopyrimidine deaminase/5-amino-6-(5-phosphoribosylamino)uracil reductase RibD [Paraflavisolibacter caeni]